MRLFNLILLVTSALILTACATGQSNQPQRIEPGWVKGDNAKYSARVFVVGQGNYKYLAKAKENARKEIAKQFEIELNKELFSFLKLPRTFTTSTDALLSEIQIIDSWQNPATSNHHVFATLPRKQAYRVIKKKISKLDDSTRTIIDRTAIEKDKLQKFIYANQAFELQLERFAHQQALTKIFPTGLAMPYIWKIPKLNNDLEKLLHRIRIKPYVINDDTKQIENALTQGLRSAGITVDTGKTADFVLQARLVLDYQNKKIETHFDTKGEIIISLTDKNKKTRVKHSWPIDFSVPQSNMTNETIGELAINIFSTKLLSALIQDNNKEK